MLMLKGLVRSLFQIGFFAAVLLIIAGTWRWPRAIQFLSYILFLTGLGLWLGSVLSALVMPVIVAPIVARILIEEKNLREHLPGYAEHMTQVPYRLVPLAW